MLQTIEVVAVAVADAVVIAVVVAVIDFVHAQINLMFKFAQQRVAIIACQVPSALFV